MKIEDFERKQKYFDAFWEKEVIDRPLVAVKTAMKPMLPIAYYECVEKGDYRTVLEKTAENIGNTWYGGEAIPSFECTFGPDQFASFLGGKIIFAKETGTTWVKPFWDDDYSENSVQFDTSEDSSFDKLMKFIKFSAEFANGRFFINMLDIHSNMDAIMAARGSQNLCMDLAEDPDKVEKVLNKILPLFPKLVDCISEAGNMEKNGYSCWIPTYCREKYSVIQCDFSIMISPEMTRRFVVPALEYEASCLKHCIYHYDGVGALSHLDEILGIKEIDAIQWVPGAGQPRTIEWMDLLKKIQKSGKGLWLSDWTAQEIKERFKELDPKGLMFDTWVNSREEGEELLENIKNNM
jgi:5-methyltetrahydrofolate--homocysteine methyltransferase